MRIYSGIKSNDIRVSTYEDPATVAKFATEVCQQEHGAKAISDFLKKVKAIRVERRLTLKTPN